MKICSSVPTLAHSIPQAGAAGRPSSEDTAGETASSRCGGEWARAHTVRTVGLKWPVWLRGEPTSSWLIKIVCKTYRKLSNQPLVGSPLNQPDQFWPTVLTVRANKREGIDEETGQILTNRPIRTGFAVSTRCKCCILPVSCIALVFSTQIFSTFRFPCQS